MGLSWLKLIVPRNGSWSKEWRGAVRSTPKLGPVMAHEVKASSGAPLTKIGLDGRWRWRLFGVIGTGQQMVI
nr:hypothetical protein CFP56_32957 [Quercus suber]